MNFEDPIAGMHKYTRNPGHVVQIVRKTIVFLQGEMISLRVVREINEIMQKISPEIVSCIDKTMSGFIMWDLIRHSLDFYRLYGLYHYNLDIFEKDLVIDDHEASLNLSDMQCRSLKNIPVSMIGEMASIRNSRYEKHERNSDCYYTKRKNRAKDRNNEEISPIKNYDYKKKKSNHIVKDLSIENLSDSDCYETFITEKFREFLVEKLKNGKQRSKSLKEKKNELLKEFNNFIKDIDNEKISKLWEEENFTTENSKSSVILSN